MPFEIRIEEIKPRPANYPLNLVKALEAEIQKALTGPVKTEVKRAFEKRTGDWKRRPEWVAPLCVPGPCRRARSVTDGLPARAAPQSVRVGDTRYALLPDCGA